MVEARKIAVVYKTREPEALRVIDMVKKLLKPESIEEYSLSSLVGKRLEGFDLIVCLGGDGTLVRTCRVVENGGVILPVNMGKKGYLMEVDPEKLASYLIKYQNNEFLVEKCFKLRIGYGGKVLTAVNEVVIRNIMGLKQVTLSVELEEGGFIVEGDGVLISTPLGSSAYSLNAGGPFVLSNVNILVCTPLCARKPLRPLIVNKDAVIKVKYLSGEEIQMIIDGEEAFKVDPKETIEITGSTETVNIIRFSSSFNIKRMGRLTGGVENG
ncbi:MAG: NAD(+)/NADH kinase [Candidatus Brockarchaeota archaeon]|nr:NAD(+)/NADH kinase [Candidatus Brockarchaeota archaeon]